ncbi:MAG: universal stress protein [Rhodoferax sp.]|nr:universal stress protein [Rhodoferax sp.]
MYRHLLVPIDGSLLSNHIVEQAVAFAQSVGSRLTFLHAQADFGATGAGALMRSTDQAAFNESAAGTARALLAKAESAARAAKVECNSLALTSDKPDDTILQVAASQGCDLIFMASHGRRGIKGMWLGSVMKKVLQRATVPVLVAAIEGNLVQNDEVRAVATIKDEHRSLAAVIHGLRMVMQERVGSKSSPDFSLLRAMLFYIKAFPDRLHHPKEEAYLFRKLSERTSECDSVIAQLQQQHVEGAQELRQLDVALARYEIGEVDAEAAFASAVDRFAQSQWTHMSVEEKLILPAASRHLQPIDWSSIAQAFQDNGDPRFGADTQESFVQLSSRLHNLAATHSS